LKVGAGHSRALNDAAATPNCLPLPTLRWRFRGN
jgi:hypothetical protein